MYIGIWQVYVYEVTTTTTVLFYLYVHWYPVHICVRSNYNYYTFTLLRSVTDSVKICYFPAKIASSGHNKPLQCIYQMKGLKILKRITFREIDYQMYIYITDRSKIFSFSHFGPFCRIFKENQALFFTKSAVKSLLWQVDNFPKRQKMWISIGFPMG